MWISFLLTIVAIVVFHVLAALIYRYKWEYEVRKKSRSKVPIPKLPYNWGLGQAVDMGDLYRFARAIREWGRYFWRRGEKGDIFVRFTGLMPIVSIQHPRYVKEALTTLKLNKFTLLRLEFKRAFGNGVITTSGKEWRSKRSALAKMFTEPSMARLSSSMASSIKDALRKEFSSSRHSTTHDEEGKLYIKLDVVPAISNVTLRVFCKTVFGMIDDSQIDVMSHTWEAIAVDMLNGVTLAFIFGDLPRKLPLPMNLRLKQNKKRMVNILDQIIGAHLSMDSKKRGQAVSKDSDENPVGDILAMHIASLEDPGSLKKDPVARRAIAEEQLVMLFAGYETTANTLSYCLYMLGRHPELQEKLHQEVHGALCDQELSMAAVSGLDYLDRFIKETMRLYPTVSEIDKEAPPGGVHLLDYYIPGGTMVSVNPVILHINPEVWGEDAELFDPDRWLPERIANYPGKDRLRYAYVPFSLGARDCLGRYFAIYESKLALSSIVNKYRVELDMPVEDIENGIMFAIAIRCSTLKLKLTERQ